MSHIALTLRRVVLPAAVVAIHALGCGSAQATYSVCNRSGSEMRVALAYVAKDAPGVSTAGRASTVEGWWTFVPGECAQISGIDAGAYWVSIYAESRPTGRVLSGREPRYCVSSRNFNESQLSSSPCRGTARPVGFMRDPTEKRNHTFTIR